MLPPIDTSGADVTALPVKHKAPPDGSLMLVPPKQGGCIHWNTSFEIDALARKLIEARAA